MKHLIVCLMLLVPGSISAENVIITLKNGETHTGSLAGNTDTTIALLKEPSRDKIVFALSSIAEVVLGEITLQGEITQERITAARTRSDEKKMGIMQRKEEEKMRRERSSQPAPRVIEKPAEKKTNPEKQSEIPWQPIDTAAPSTASSTDTLTKQVTTSKLSREELSLLTACPHCGAINYQSDLVCGTCSKQMSSRPVGRAPKGRNSQPQDQTAQKYIATIQIVAGSLGALFTVLDAVRPWNLVLQSGGTRTAYEAHNGWTYGHSAGIGLSFGLLASGSMTLYFASK